MSKSRNEQDELALSVAERAHLREGFARLLPTPELEVAVQEIATAAPLATSRWKGRLGLVATVAVAAAVLFALYVPKGEDDTPAGPGDAREAAPSGLVAHPPSAEEIDAARRASRLPQPEMAAGAAPRWHHEGRTPGGGFVRIATGGFLPPIPQMQHRWVVREDDTQFAKPDEYGFGMPPGDGRMLVGAGILNALGGIASFDKDGALVVRTKNGEWRALPGSATAELEISSPEEGGATARIRVGISTAYEGSLVVEAPLARALGLHHFEHPRGALLGGPLKWRATQSYARIRIPAVEFDETMLVQVREPQSPPKPLEFGALPPAPRKTVIEIRGTDPDRVAHASAVRFLPDNTLEVEDQGSGMTLGLRRPEKSTTANTVSVHRLLPMDVCLVYDGARRRRPDAYLFAGRFDAFPIGPETISVRTEWRTLRLPKAPGARVTLARTWRGNTAVPSREGVTITWVDEKGTLHWPRLIGEEPAPLRMLVEPKKGKPFFQMLDLDARSGNVTFDGFRGHLRIDAKGVITPLGAGPIDTGSERARSLALLEWLRRATKSVPRTEAGTSQLELAVETDTATPLSAWLTVLRVAAHPDVRLRRLKLSVISARAQRRDAGRTVTYRLPMDRPLEASPVDTSRPVRFFIEGEALGQRVTLREPDFSVLGPPQTEEEDFIRVLRSELRRRGAGRPDLIVRIVPLTETKLIRMRLVALLLEALEGLENLGFEDRP